MQRGSERRTNDLFWCLGQSQKNHDSVAALLPGKFLQKSEKFLQKPGKFLQKSGKFLQKSGKFLQKSGKF